MPVVSSAFFGNKKKQPNYHSFFVMVHAGTASWHLFHVAGKCCENHLNTWASVLVLDVYTGTFLFPEKAPLSTVQRLMYDVA